MGICFCPAVSLHSDSKEGTTSVLPCKRHMHATHALRKGLFMAQFTNQAQLSYNNSTVSSNTVIGQLQEVLSLSKTPINRSYRPGDTITYAINLINSGTSALTNLRLTDDLGAYTIGSATYVPLTYTEDSVRYFVNGVLQATPTATAGNTLSFSGINIPAGGNAAILYDAEVNGFADPTAAGSITNAVTAEGTGITALTASGVVPASAEPLLSITKSLSPVPVVENGLLTYTFTIENIGSAAATADGNVTVTDTFQPILSGISVTLDGTVLTRNTDYTYNETTGEFATIPGKITIPSATFAQGTDGVWTVSPGSVVLTVSGTV